MPSNSSLPASAATGKDVGVSPRRSLFVWGMCCALAGVVFLIYTLTGLAAGRGRLVLPLDDVYIHFQYAHAIAVGHPYVYSPGFLPSSGATSFLYPYILAVGDLIGFRGLSLGYWAMGIGALALAGASWLVYRLAQMYTPHWFSVYATALFALSGPVSWHFMSGMETGLVVLLTLATLYLTVSGRFRAVMVSAALLALMRPEGGILAALVVVLTLTPRPPLPQGEGENDGVEWTGRSPSLQAIPLSDWLWRILPLAAIAIQPAVNFLVTGSAVASGNAAKSIFGMIPAYPDVIAGRILGNFGRMWTEFVVPGYFLELSSVGLWGVGALALVGVWSLRHNRRMLTLLVIWFAAGTLAVSTLDTAFWHFKRYQMPFIAVFYPLAAWGVIWLWTRVGAHRRAPLQRAAILVAAVVALVTGLTTAARFWVDYRENASYVYQQPLQMADWLNANTPPDAVIAVHDTGLIPYLTQRPAIDLVGLTSAGAADSWRNGPGAVAEFLESSQPRPDTVAAYTDALGLRYLADTDIYGAELAAYPVKVDSSLNVALAADFQGIYRPDWTAADRAPEVMQPSTLDYVSGFELVDSLDVADLTSERAHGYRWNDGERLPGFPTEVYEMDYAACGAPNCHMLDGGRLINGEESFTLATQPGKDLILVTRLHPHDSGTFDVYANGERAATRWIPSIPGQWLETAALIPARLVTAQMAIRIVPHTPDGHYMPYYHWAYQGTYPAFTPGQAEATFENGAIILADHEAVVDTDSHRLRLSLTWASAGDATGDYKVFVHVVQNINEAPVAQADARPGQGALPPGNWLPGVIHDTMEIDLSQVPPGEYRIAIGLYDPLTNERLAPSGGDEQNRLFLETVEIP